MTARSTAENTENSPPRFSTAENTEDSTAEVFNR